MALSGLQAFTTGTDAYRGSSSPGLMVKSL